MKKIIKLIVLIVFTFLLVGCKDKTTNKEEMKENGETSLINNLYSDDSKIVYDNGGIYKIVFYFSGNKITNEKNVYEYKTEEEAKLEYDNMKQVLKSNETIKDIKLEGKYIIYTLDSSQYMDLTKENVIENYSYLEEVLK